MAHIHVMGGRSLTRGLIAPVPIVNGELEERSKLAENEGKWTEESVEGTQEGRALGQPVREQCFVPLHYFDAFIMEVVR